MTAPLLQIRNVSRSFGGIHAVSNVTMDVPEGSIHSLIGPNGAGKTTLFNMISGIYRPSGGDILLNGVSIAGQAPAKLAARGLSRTFQNLQIFTQMTALENVLVGAHLRMNSGLIAGMLPLPGLRRAEKAAAEEAMQLLGFVDLAAMAGTVAGSLPFGVLKRLEIARALMARPKLLLLDEPAAGLNPSEKLELQALIRKVAQQGVTTLLVEHDMKMVMSLSDHIFVLANGTKLAEGTADQVRNHPAVIEAYLSHPREKASVSHA